MSKILYYALMLICFNILSCKAQKNDSLNVTSSTMKKLNFKSFESLNIDKTFPQTSNDIHYRLGNEMVRVTKGKKDIQVEYSSTDVPFKSVELYSIKDSLLIKEGKLFFNFPVGIWTEYDKDGKVLDSINYDKNFNFSIQNLIQKMDMEFGINMLEKDRIIARRYVVEDISKSFYEVFHKMTIEREQLDCFLLDGNSGTLLYRKVQYQQDKNGSLYQQYINDVK